MKHVPVGLNVPAAEQLAPVWDTPLSTATPHPGYWLVGAHGGAGVSTLSRTWAPAGDGRGGWPGAERHPYAIVVARTHRSGLTAAHVLLRQAAADLIGECTLLGLVTVADHTGALPSTLRRQLELVEELAPHAWRIPFVPAYRLLSTEQLPTWSPREDTPAPQSRRFVRDPDPAHTVPSAVAATGAAIFAAARAAITHSQ